MDTSGSVVFQGFTVVPFKVEEKSTCLHYLYVKEHNVRDTQAFKPKERTLFILNIPPYCDEENLKEMFDQLGIIQRVYIHSKPTSGLPAVNQSNFFPTAPVIQGYKVAYVVFKKPSSVKAATNLPFDKPLILQRKGGLKISAGLSKWVKEYKDDIINTSALQSEIDKYMQEYDEKMNKEIEEAKATEGVPDDEGWVTVTKFSKKGAPRTEAHEKALNRKEKKRRKEKELLNFYSFQIRDTKREQIANLRQKFEEDKQRIALMKAARKFRPY